MRFSLILCTVGRTGEPQRFLEALNTQDHRDFELVVVDQNPDDRLVALLEDYGARFSVTHVREHKIGLSRARNIGLEYASGDIIAFPDDDCWYPADLLRKVAQTLTDYPNVDGLTGRLTDERGRDVMGRFDPRSGRIEKPNVWARGVEATTFLRRSCIKDLRFDESLGLGSGTMWAAGEGTDFLLRMLADGRTLYYFPEIVISHPPFATLHDAKASQKAYSYGCGMGRVLRKHKTPLRSKAKWLIRPLGGAILYLMRGKTAEALYYFNTCRGRLRGLLS